MKAAKKFPSIKRNGIIKEIRESFRNNKGEKDPKKISDALNVANTGLAQLRMYSSLPTGEKSWVVDLNKNPFPMPQSK